MTNDPMTNDLMTRGIASSGAPSVLPGHPEVTALRKRMGEDTGLRRSEGLRPRWQAFAALKGASATLAVLRCGGGLRDLACADLDVPRQQSADVYRDKIWPPCRDRRYCHGLRGRGHEG